MHAQQAYELNSYPTTGTGYMPPRRRPRRRLGIADEAHRTLAIVRGTAPLPLLTCDGCENEVDLSAPALRELYADRKAPGSQVEVLCPDCEELHQSAGKCAHHHHLHHHQCSGSSSILTQDPSHTHSQNASTTASALIGF